MTRRLAFLVGAVLAMASFGTAGSAEISPVRIGILNDMETTFAAGGGRGSVEAARMAAEDAGDVLGKPVEIVSADHQNKADIGSAIARKWFDQDGVDVIADVPNSAVAFAVQDIATQERKLFLVVGGLSSDLTGVRCTPYTAAWGTDTYAQARVVGTAVVKAGGTKWFFLSVDYAGGRALVKDASTFVQASGGTVVGGVYPPINTTDFSSYLLQAQSSGAQVIALANGGSDIANAIKQGGEFGIQRGGQYFASFTIFINDVKSLGLAQAQGLRLASPYYWDLDEPSRAFARRFRARVGAVPSWNQAAVYSAVNHYLNSVKAVGTKNADQVMARMRETPISDFMSKDAHLRADGRVVRDIHLFAVKTPAESTGQWDLYKYLGTVPGEQAFRPLSEGNCPLVTDRAVAR